MVTTARIHASPRRSRRVQGLAAKSKFRPEIQGLRSLAVLMVVTYHIWFGRVSGGVDVFLLISAFLMTLQFTSRYEQHRPMALIKHWLHLFRRLLPAVVVVLTATLLASYIFLPRNRWLEVVNQGWASLFYYQNRLLQTESVDYYATDHSLASPLQHFWSLSIQGQVFILWPLVFAGAAWLAHRYRLRYRALLTYVFGAIFVVSLTYSAIFTAINQAQAYFDTFARLWEFALGTLVALILPGLYLSKAVRVVLGWVGVAAMLSCGILLQVQTAFPGFVALWPTLAASFVIVAGQTGSRIGVDRILSSRFLVRLGDNSYALYLWHWPVLVIALSLTGREHAGWLSGTLIIVVSLVLAILTTKHVEKPLREWKWPEVKRRRAAIAIVGCLVAASIPLTGFKMGIQIEAAMLKAQSAKDNPGAAALQPGFVFQGNPDAKMIPALTELPADWPTDLGECRPLPGHTEAAGRTECDTGTDGNPSKTVVIFGSSHTFVLATPMLEIAREHGWRVITITGGFCPLTQGADPTVPEGCVDFINEQSRRIAEEIRPDLLLTTSTRAGYSDEIPEFLDPGWPVVVKKFTDAGIPVLAVRDTPRFDRRGAEAAPDCIAKDEQNAGSCSVAQSDVYDAVPPTDSIKGQLPGVSFVDLTEYLCTNGRCPGVIGNVIAYKDSNHLSATFARTLKPMLEERLLAATGWS